MKKTKVLAVIMSLAMAMLVLTGCASWIDRASPLQQLVLRPFNP